MSHRAAVLSLALSASIVFCLPLRAQRNVAPGELIGNTSGPANSGQPGSVFTADAGSISGTVSTSDHHPAVDARVEVRNISNGSMAATGYVNPNGTFVLKGLPLGAYEVVATSGISEAREQVQVEATDTSVNLMLPHTSTTDPNGQQMVSVSALRVPEKAQREVEKAREALQKNNYEDAGKRVDKALSIEPRYADALVLRGVLEMQQNNLQSASNDFTSALKYDASSAMAYIGTGAIFNMQGRYDDALRELDRGAALNPAAWQAQFEMAKANLGKGSFEAALKNANRAEDLAPADFAAVHLIKGHAFLGLKDYSSAVSEFEAFLTKDSKSPDAPSVRQQLQEAKAFVTTARAEAGK